MSEINDINMVLKVKYSIEWDRIIHGLYYRKKLHIDFESFLRHVHFILKKGHKICRKSNNSNLTFRNPLG